MGKFYYKIYGLSFESEVELPGLTVEECPSVDIKIVLGRNPDHLPIISKVGVLYEASRNDFLFRLKNIGSFRVENGVKITIEPSENVSVSEFMLFLLGTTMGALFHQRGILPLHGSAIKVNDLGIIIIGHSAAGKSTVAAGFSEKGFSIVSDDISALSIDKHGDFHVQPGLPYLRLWKDSLVHLNYHEKLEKVRPQIPKYIKPLCESFFAHSVKVYEIVYLGSKNSEGFSHELIQGNERFNVLRNQTYRFQFVSGLGKISDHFRLISALSKKVTLHKVERPESPLMVFELVEYILDHVISR